MVLITVLSVSSFESTNVGLNIPYRDKMAHFVFHAAATVLGCLFLRERSQGTRPMKRAIMTMVGSLFLYGIIIEVLQLKFTTTRMSEILDVIANTVGALSGAVTVRVLYKGKWQLKW
jgi:VanZ family protein